MKEIGRGFRCCVFDAEWTSARSPRGAVLPRSPNRTPTPCPLAACCDDTTCVETVGSWGDVFQTLRTTLQMTQRILTQSRRNNFLSVPGVLGVGRTHPPRKTPLKHNLVTVKDRAGTLIPATIKQAIWSLRLESVWPAL